LQAIALNNTVIIRSEDENSADRFRRLGILSSNKARIWMLSPTRDRAVPTRCFALTLLLFLFGDNTDFFTFTSVHSCRQCHRNRTGSFWGNDGLMD
jgi:hypothetical protein